MSDEPCNMQSIPTPYLWVGFGVPLGSGANPSPSAEGKLTDEYFNPLTDEFGNPLIAP